MPVSEVFSGYGRREIENRSMATGIQRVKIALFLEAVAAYGIHSKAIKYGRKR
jgi:hypothetical protein